VAELPIRAIRFIRGKSSSSVAGLAPVSVPRICSLKILRKESDIAMQFDFPPLIDSSHFSDLPPVGKNGSKFCTRGFGKTESDAKCFRVAAATKCRLPESGWGFVHFEAKVLSHAKVMREVNKQKKLAGF
jgi:hypothetical protein